MSKCFIRENVKESNNFGNAYADWIAYNNM